VIAAFVIERTPGTVDAEGLRDFCHGKIAHYKIPRYVVAVDDFPMTVSGKVQKFKLREQAIERFDLQAALVDTA
jgi:fatty-acyl-CoA synthase